jgi:hypothetical protein
MTTKEEIQELKDTARKLLDKAKELEHPKSGYWKPKYGGEYWYIYNCSIDHFSWATGAVDLERLQVGNIYQTEVEARKEVECRKALQRIRKYIHENMPFVPDWKDDDQSKTSVYFSYYDGNLYACESTADHDQPDNLYLGSHEDGEKLIKDMEEDLLIYLGVDK